MRKTAADQTWLICLKAEILEVSCTSVISRLNNNKQDATVVARGFEENKKWLMFLQGKRQQEMYVVHLKRLKRNIQVIAQVFWG